ncbi:MAG: winged helix-turn-helix domain-containing protein [Anaerolineales bacterium]
MMENKLNPAPAPLFACGALHLRRDTKLALVADQPVPLTPLEYNLLIYLFRHRTRAVSPEELLDAVWDCPHGGTVNQVKSSIKRLRKKLAVEADTPQYIHTVRGFGYRLCEPGSYPPPPDVNGGDWAADT